MRRVAFTYRLPPLFNAYAGAEHDAGELEKVDTYGTQEVKQAAGDLILRPSTCLHPVKPMTRDVRAQLGDSAELLSLKDHP